MKPKYTRIADAVVFETALCEGCDQSLQETAEFPDGKVMEYAICVRQMCDNWRVLPPLYKETYAKE